jgi:hypothetical protein
VIDRFSGWLVMLYLGAVLLGVAVAEAAVLTGVARLIGPDQLTSPDVSVPAVVGFWRPLLFSTAGWVIGLWASGFPRLVMAGRPATAPQLSKHAAAS